MLRLVFATVALFLLAAPWCAQADPENRLRALMERAEFRPVFPTGGGFALEGRTAALTDTGDGAESLFCLNFDKKDTRRMLGVKKSHAYVCFNFLQNPSEAVGNILGRNGQDRCLITGYFGEGRTIEEDCLVLAFCNRIFVAGSCR